MKDNIPQYCEEVLWTNSWVSYANTNNIKQRFLLIGDSVTRQFRSKMEALLDKIAVDLFASSIGVESPMFLSTMDSFFKNYTGGGIKLTIFSLIYHIIIPIFLKKKTEEKNTKEKLNLYSII